MDAGPAPDDDDGRAPDAQPPVDRHRLAERLLGQRDLLIRRIRRVLARHGGSREHAEDVFSTTLRRADLLAATGRLIDGISDDHLLALASAIARNAAREKMRAAKRLDERHRRAAEEDRDRDPEPALDATTARPESVDALLSALSPADFAVLSLRLRGLRWAVIAAELATTPAGAQMRFYRAVRALAAADPDRTREP